MHILHTKPYAVLRVILPCLLAWLVTFSVASNSACSAEIPEGKFEDHAAELKVVLGQTKLLRAAGEIYRVAVVDSSVCDVIQFSPKEVSIVGKKVGDTHVTVWVKEGQTPPLLILVRVKASAKARQ